MYVVFFGPAGQQLTTNHYGLDHVLGAVTYELGIIAGNVPLGMGHFLGSVESPHDGTIAVEETRLAGATDHIVLPVSHLSVLLSKRAADQVLHFLRYGRFVHESSRDNPTSS